MLKDLGVKIVGLGHSERRIGFGEIDCMMNRKTLAAVRHGLRPLICVGETLAEKDAGCAATTVSRQVIAALQDVPEHALSSVIIAYEPVWAIGEQGSAAGPEYANVIHGAIRASLPPVDLPDGVKSDIPILYGGSVSLENAAGYVQQPYIDGLFVGRAGLEAEALIEILRIVEANSE